MNSFLYSLGFHRSGKPRKWLRLVLFRSDSTTRPMFQRIVHRKSGSVRPRFAGWIKASASSEQIASQRGDDHALRPAEIYLMNLKPLEQTVDRWRKTKPLPPLMEAQALKAALQVRSPTAKRGLFLCVSHDNYRKELGGVQLCVQREEVMAQAKGFDYLQIHPWQPLPRLAHQAEDADIAVCLMLNGTEAGACRMSTLTQVVADLAGPGKTAVHLVIHQMLGHSPEQLADLATATGTQSCIFWLHDFLSICPSHTLQRNGLSFCNAPPMTSNACNLCVAGPERLAQTPRMAAFFDRVAVDVISPSQHTADLWQAKSGLKARSLRVIPHVDLHIAPRPASPLAPAAPGAPIRIGHLGSQAAHKGWHVFAGLMNDPDRAANLEFVVLSAKRPQQGEDDWKPVSVSTDTPAAMTEAVEAQGLDLVLNWPEWPETFSYTTFEALAGSAYVVTNPWSGNIAAAVQASGRGVVLQDDQDLFDFFHSDRLKDLVARRRSDRQATQIEAVHSDLTYHLLEEV